MMSEIPDLKQPIFVVGHPRSGTTLLATVLGRHPDLAMPPETQFFIEQRRRLRGQISAAQMDEILDNWRIIDLELDRDAAQAAFARTDHSPRAVFATLLDLYRQGQGKPRVGEKSPMHLHNVETLLGWFPDARIVGIERNGVDVVGSMLAMPWAHDHAGKHALTWVAACKRIRALEAQFPANFMWLKFEAFTAAPEAQIRRVCDFCGLDFRPEMLNPKATQTVPDWEKDWKQSAARPITPQKSKALDSFTPAQRAQLGAVANTMLVQTGYPTVPIRALQRLRVWATLWPWHPVVRPYIQEISTRVRRKSNERFDDHEWEWYRRG